MRLNNRNKQAFWYAPYTGVDEDYWHGNQVGAHGAYGNPVKVYGVISPARGRVVGMPFGVDEQYDVEILLEDRDTPIDEYAVLWIESQPELDENGALVVNAAGEPNTPRDYVVRRVSRGLPTFGETWVAAGKVNA